MRANLLSTKVSESSQVNASARKAWPNGVASFQLALTCVSVCPGLKRRVGLRSSHFISRRERLAKYFSRDKDFFCFVFCFLFVRFIYLFVVFVFCSQPGTFSVRLSRLEKENDLNVV